MAHLVEQMFSVREVPWHGLGHVVQEAPNVETAIKLAGLGWKAVEKPIYDERGQVIPGYKSIARDDNQKVLSIMKPQYHPLQNQEAFNFFNPFIDSGLASLETAGSLKDGKIIWILASLSKAPIEIGKGDYVKKNLLLSNSHDGSMAVRVGFTPIRVVCNNTLTRAHNSKQSELIRIKHSSKVVARLDDLRQVVNAIDANFQATADQYKALAKTSISRTDLENYIQIIFDTNPNGSERDKQRDKKMKETITRLFENGAGAQLKSAKGTYWGAYNAVTEYLTHEHGKDTESRLYGNWFSDLGRKNEKALSLALEAL